jgi:DNA-binding response OmpR family regulator
MRQLLATWLREVGYVVELYASLPEASDFTPELVIVSVPRSIGPKALIDVLLRRYGVPVVAISGRFRRGLGNSSAAAKRLGASKVLPKPFARDELLNAIAQSLERRGP